MGRMHTDKHNLTVTMNEPITVTLFCLKFTLMFQYDN